MARLFLVTVIVLGVAVLGWYVLQHGIGFSISDYIGGSTISGTPSYTYTNTSEDSIFITSPKPAADVTSTIVVHGFARGNWYFEAVFPMVVLNQSGLVIGQGQGKAGADWTTNSFVPFTAEVDLQTPYTGAAEVILKNDNASGDPARDASVSFPVIVQ